MTPPRLHRIADPAELEQDLRDALELVERLEPPADLRLALFNLAAQALMQRAMEQQPLAFAAPDLSKLGRGH